MGNECSADCRPQPAAQPLRRTVRSKDPPVELHTKAMAVQRMAVDWRSRYQPSEELGEGATATVLHAAEKGTAPATGALLFRCQAVGCKPFGFSSGWGRRPWSLKEAHGPKERDHSSTLPILQPSIILNKNTVVTA